MSTKMRIFLILALALTASLFIGAAAPAYAAATLYVDDDGVCGGNTPCYLHPQDAVNAAAAGDTIEVYPGTYGSRYFECPWAPNCSGSDNYSPALIVYKDNLTIYAVDPDPALTVIESTHNFWSNAIAVENSTAGGVTGIGGWAPNAITVVASGATIEGFTIRRPYTCEPNVNDCFFNTAGVFIGSKGAGYADFVGSANNNIVLNNVMTDVWQGVYIWQSDGNRIEGNDVTANPINHWAAISIYDGWDGAPINPSQDNQFINNTLSHGLAVGAWPGATNNSGTVIDGNTVTRIMFTYSTSDGVQITGNTVSQDINTHNTGSFTNLNVSGNTVLPGTGNGILIQYATGVTVNENDVRERTANAIAILDATGVSAERNTVANNSAAGFTLVRVDGAELWENWIVGNVGNTANPAGLTLREGTANVYAHHNYLIGNTIGVWAKSDAGAGHAVHENAIISSPTAGIQNDSASQIDAVRNWWGCGAGPGATGCTVVVGDVVFEPWIIIGNETFEWDFEPDWTADGWPDYWIPKILNANDQWDCTAAHSGECSFMLAGDGIKKKLREFPEITGLAGDSFTFSLWAKAENITDKPIIRIALYDAAGERQRVTLKPNKGTYDWTEFTTAFTADFDYTKIKVTIKLKSNKGSLWVDDVVLMRPVP